MCLIIIKKNENDGRIIDFEGIVCQRDRRREILTQPLTEPNDIMHPRHLQYWNMFSSTFH